jgi:prevent-host-death family protein
MLPFLSFRQKPESLSDWMLTLRYSTSDLSRKSGDIIARALQGPVTITQRGKPRLILMSVEEYNRLRGKRGDGPPSDANPKP